MEARSRLDKSARARLGRPEGRLGSSAITERRDKEFAVHSVRRGLHPPAPETLSYIRQTDSCRTAAQQCDSGTSERVLVMLLERTLLAR